IDWQPGDASKRATEINLTQRRRGAEEEFVCIGMPNILLILDLCAFAPQRELRFFLCLLVWNRRLISRGCYAVGSGKRNHGLLCGRWLHWRKGRQVGDG